MHNSAAVAAPRRDARIAGALYLLVIVAGVFAQLLVRDRLVVPGNAELTARNILGHQQLFRWGFAAEIAAGLCVIPLILLLYDLFAIVNRRIALLAVYFSLVGAAVQSVSLLGHFAPLLLLARGSDTTIPPDLPQALSYMALRLHSIGYAVALAFFGGTMLARGYLILRSTFFPRPIGALLVVEGVCYLANSFADFVAPQAAPAVFAALMASGIAEVLVCLWLLLVGVHEGRWRAQALATAA